MEQYTVEITNEALRDMQAIYDYIAVELLVPDTAMEQYNRIADAILNLDVNPMRYRLMEPELKKGRERRCMPVDNYSVFYVVSGNRVVVTDVLYSASNIEVRLREF